MLIYYIHGELYMEYLKQDCQRIKGTLCSFCQENTWTGIETTRIPQPMPDRANPGHFLPVFKTPLINEDGSPRSADDWQPRVQITKAFKEGELSLEHHQAMKDVAEKICVEVKLVKECPSHCQELENLAKIRKRDRTSKRNVAQAKSCDSYDWLSLTLSGGINKLKVYELDKYLEKYGLSRKGRKADK